MERLLISQREAREGVSGITLALCAPVSSVGLLLANASIIWHMQSSDSDKETGNKPVYAFHSQSSESLLLHVLSFAETKVCKHPLVGFQPDASHRIDLVLSSQVPALCRCTRRTIAFHFLIHCKGEEIAWQSEAMPAAGGGTELFHQTSLHHILARQPYSSR